MVVLLLISREYTLTYHSCENGWTNTCIECINRKDDGVWVFGAWTVCVWGWGGGGGAQ